MSIDLWIDKCACHAKMIVVRLLGGLDWWRYGVEALGAVARDKGIALAVLPGEDRDDARLDDASTLPPDELAALLAYFREGGARICALCSGGLRLMPAQSLGCTDPSPVPRMDGYLPGSGAVTLARLAATLRARASRSADPVLSLGAARLGHRTHRCAVRGALGAWARARATIRPEP